MVFYNQIRGFRSILVQNYRTVEEKASEWNVTPRHVQHLCKNGKIPGAIKKAGVWFIPEDCSVPVKNTKSDTPNFEFVGTRKDIFESAIELFMLKGFENVSIKDIADDVGITQGAIYNHFKSKQDILDTTYNFYCHYHIIDRLTLEQIEPILHSGSLMDIMQCFFYEYKHRREMTDITKIIFQRMSIDPQAQEIAKTTIYEEGMNFVMAVFNRAIEIGRLAPFDVYAMAMHINSIRLYTLFTWIIGLPIDTLQKIWQGETEQYRYATRFLTDLNPPAESEDKP